MKFIITYLLLINLALAHPHTFIDVYPTVTLNNNKITEVTFVWKFDEMTSSMLIMDTDENANGLIEENEKAFIYDNYFEPLSNYNFYTDISIQEEVKKLPTPSKFHAYIENNRLCYSFNLTNLQLDIKTTKFDFGDTDFFVAMVLKKEFITLNSNNAKVSDLDNDFYFGYRMEIQ